MKEHVYALSKIVCILK